MERTCKVTDISLTAALAVGGYLSPISRTMRLLLPILAAALLLTSCGRSRLPVGDAAPQFKDMAVGDSRHPPDAPPPDSPKTLYDAIWEGTPTNDAGKLWSCGDKICQHTMGEHCLSCPQDCGKCLANCDDGVCDWREFEDCITCPKDCGPCK